MLPLSSFYSCKNWCLQTQKLEELNFKSQSYGPVFKDKRVCTHVCVHVYVCVVIMYVPLLNTYYWADIVLYEFCVSMCVFMFVCVLQSIT